MQMNYLHILRNDALPKPVASWDTELINQYSIGREIDKLNGKGANKLDYVNDIK